MEALMCLFGIAIGAGLITGLWCVAKFAARAKTDANTTFEPFRS